MPMPIHMFVTGEKQGDIAGACMMAGDREGSIMVDALCHKVTIPFNPQDGQPTGQRIHGPLEITKIVDQASPLLSFALCTGESLTVTLKWYRQSGATEEHYFTTVLENARVVCVRAFIPNVFDEAKAQYQHMEEVHLTYQKIIWTHTVEGKESEDDWLTPAS